MQILTISKSRESHPSIHLSHHGAALVSDSIITYDKVLSKCHLGMICFGCQKEGQMHKTLKIPRIQMHKAWRLGAIKDQSERYGQDAHKFLTLHTFLCVASTHVVEYWWDKMYANVCLVWMIRPLCSSMWQLSKYFCNVDLKKGMTSKKGTRFMKVQQELMWFGTCDIVIKSLM